jgi:hypothetical protein
MRGNRVVMGYRVGFALLILAAIVTQCLAAAQRPAFSLVNFFSFFTIESNIFAAVTLLASSLAARRKKQWVGLDLYRGAATVYMTTTGLIYVLLLSKDPVAVQTTIPWVNMVLHYAMPIVILLDWAFVPPKRRIALRTIPLWLTFPVAYLAYSWLRGPYAGWYPYPFLDPRLHSVEALVGYALAIAVAIVVICFGVRAIGSRRKR